MARCQVRYNARCRRGLKDRKNRRKHVRTRVNFKACVRRSGTADDTASPAKYMSRGGLRFKSSKKVFR